MKKNTQDERETEFEQLINQHQSILIFIPNTNELQRFVLAGAFEELGKSYKLHYVLPGSDAEKMRSAAPGILTSYNTSVLSIPPERFSQWSKLFQKACLQYAHRSTSFAIRANLEFHSQFPGLLRVLPIISWRPVSKIIQLMSKYNLGFLNKPVKDALEILQKAIANKEKMGNIKSPIFQAHTDAEALRKHSRLFRSVPKLLLPFLFYCIWHSQKINYLPDWLQHRLKAWRNVMFDHTKDYIADTALFPSMDPLEEIIELIDHFTPLCCLLPTSLLDLFCGDIVLACEKEGVLCLLLQSGWDNLSSKGLLHARSPFLGCWGPQSERHAVDIQCLSQERIQSMGAPHYEFLIEQSQESIAQFRSQFGISAEQKLILFGGAFRQFDETGILCQLEKAIEQGVLGDVKILYRPHPWRAARKYEDSFFKYQWKHVFFDPDMEERYLREQQETGYIKRNVPMFDMAYLSLVLSAVDAVISPMSTLLVESLIMKKPTMAIAFGDGKHSHNPSVTSQMTHFKEARHSDALIYCDNDKNLFRDCIQLLKPVSTATVEARQKLLQDIVTTHPGSYAERLAKFFEMSVKPKASNMRGKRTARKRITISHAYGAHRIAREYCDVTTGDIIIPGYWMHGWLPQYHNVDPILIALHKKEGQHIGYDYVAQIEEDKREIVQWVSRLDQVDYLRSHGYQRVKAIGLPIIYTKKPTVQRVPRSLLVMPPHSHKVHDAENELAKEYAEQIAALKSKFDHIWVGLNQDDFGKNHWVESFRRVGINIFTTTDPADPYTLVRLRKILSTFEFVTTNGFGSHIALAAYCGAKVSVFGPFAEFPFDRMKDTHAVKMVPHLQETAYRLCTEEALREHYPFLFVEPDKAETRQEWGAHEVGEDCRLSPEQLCSLFEWRGKKKSSHIAESFAELI